MYKVFIYPISYMNEDINYEDFEKDFPDWHGGTIDSIFLHSYMNEEKLFYLKLKYSSIIVAIESV